MQDIKERVSAVIAWRKMDYSKLSVSEQQKFCEIETDLCFDDDKDNVFEYVERLHTQIKELAEREAKLVDVIKFYASEGHYEFEQVHHDEGCYKDARTEVTSKIETDNGELARATIQSLGLQE